MQIQCFLELGKKEIKKKDGFFLVKKKKKELEKEKKKVNIYFDMSI